MDERRTSKPHQPSVRCLVVGPAGPDGRPALPEDLLSSLRKHDVAVSPQPGVFAAIGEMGAHQRLVRKGHATEGMALVVVDPERVARAEDLVHASERYAPSVVCWRYDSQTRMKLHAYQPRKREERADEDDAERPGGVGARPAVRPGIATRPSPAPALRLAGADARPALRLRDVDDDERSGRNAPSNDATQLLTEEELAMLLGDKTDGEGGATRRR